MIGAIIITHASVGKELIAAAEYLVGRMEGIEAVSIEREANSFEARKLITRTMQKVDQGGGLILLTDHSEGSVAHITCSFWVQEKVEVITGVNLPMILTFWNKRASHTLREVVKAIQLSGQRSINRARVLLDVNRDKRKATARKKESSSPKKDRP